MAFLKQCDQALDAPGRGTAGLFDTLGTDPGHNIGPYCGSCPTPHRCNEAGCGRTRQIAQAINGRG